MGIREYTMQSKARSGLGKNGIFFSLDAIIALTIMTMGLLLIMNSYVAERQISKQVHTSEDVIAVLGELRINEVDNPLVNELIANGSIKGKALNNTILEQVTQFWAEGYPELATALILNITNQQFPDLKDFSVIVGDDTIYNKTSISTKTLVIPMRRIITGIAKDEVTRGTIARAYLTSITGKNTARYLYFGGFVGQGNITRFLTGIPSDANITDIYLEVDAGKEFNFFINDVQCGGTLSPTGGNMTADGFDLSSCNSSISLGEGIQNNFTIRFTGDSTDNESFIGGGFLRVRYRTSELLDITEVNTIKFWFPGIDGIMNLYTSISVPGTINTVDGFLHYNSNETTLLRIGEVEVHNSPGDDSDQTYTLTDTTLQSLLNYTALSNTTIPLRMFSFNVSPIEIITGGDADVILITDYSGSMKKGVNNWNQGHVTDVTDCDGSVYPDPESRRTQTARCVGKEVVKIIMNFSTNRLFPVQFVDDTVYNYTSTNMSDLLTYYEDSTPPEFPTNGKGKTCLGCAMNRAYDILDEISGIGRNKYVIVMTDGVPTTCPIDGCEGNSTVYAEDNECEGLCDQSGSCNAGNIPGQCAACTEEDGAANHTLYAAQRLRDDLNVTIYTVGFGPVSDCALADELLQKVADIGNGTYNRSNDTLALKVIYQDIAYDILERANLTSQIVLLPGGNESQLSRLYGDSYLRVNYTPTSLQNTQGMISLALESPKLNGCTDTVTIEDELTVVEARMTSYSSEHWTDALTVNGQVVYNLSRFNTDYTILGDPYNIWIPRELFVPGNNTITLRTGDDPFNETGCSLNNTLHYTAELNLSIPFGGVHPRADGCNWSIEYEDGTTGIIVMPPSPAPSKTCNFTSSSIAYDTEDAFDTAVFALLSRLDFDNDGKVNIRFEQLDLTIVFLLSEEVPSLFGPTIAEVRTWQ